MGFVYLNKRSVMEKKTPQDEKGKLRHEKEKVSHEKENPQRTFHSVKSLETRREYNGNADPNCHS